MRDPTWRAERICPWWIVRGHRRTFRSSFGALYRRRHLRAQTLPITRFNLQRFLPNPIWRFIRKDFRPRHDSLLLWLDLGAISSARTNASFVITYQHRNGHCDWCAPSHDLYAHGGHVVDFHY